MRNGFRTVPAVAIGLIGPIAFAGLLFVLLMGQAARSEPANQTPVGRGQEKEFVNTGGRGRDHCLAFARANKCRPMFDFRSVTCVCAGR